MAHVRLRPLREDEYDAFVADGIARYARDMVENSGVLEELAARKAEADYAALLPRGLATPDHHILAVEDATSGRRLGCVWFATGDVDTGPRAFVYGLEIVEGQRGRGYGKAAMRALEPRVRELGYDRIVLNVFGGNEVARSLYRSLGYTERAVIMAKELE
jgi:ribosomal protein S18 acetylase RimI-like enzyme